MKALANFWILGAIMTILIIAFISGPNLIGIANLVPGIISSGFTTLSLSAPADFQSSNPFFNGPTWILSVRQGGFGQYAAGTFSASEIKDPDGITAINNLKLEVTNDRQSCVYPIQYTGNDYKIYKLYRVIYSGAKLNPLFNVNNQCLIDSNNNGGAMLSSGYSAFSLDGVCVWKTLQGDIAKLKSLPDKQFSTTVKVTTGNIVQSGIITNTGDIQKQIGNNVWAVWNGNLETGDSCPGTQNVIAEYSNGWKLLDSSKYNNYVAAAIPIENDLSAGKIGLVTLTETDSKIQQYNSYADIAVQQAQLKSEGGSIAYTSGSVSSGAIQIDLAKSIFFPLLTFYIKADALGIVQPVPKPQIVSVPSSILMKTGTTSLIPVSVKNIGTEAGTMQLSASCQAPVSQVGSAIDVSLQPNEQRTVNIPIIGDSIARINSICTIKFQSLNNFVTASTTVTVDPIQICQPNQVICNNDKIEQCNSAGSGRFVVSDCTQLNQICVNTGQPTCVNKEFKPACNDLADNDGDAKIDLLDPGCSGPEDNDERDKDIVGNVITLFLIGLLVSSILVSVLRIVPVTRIITQPYLSTLKNKAIAIAIGAVILILLGTPFLLSTASLVGL